MAIIFGQQYLKLMEKEGKIAILKRENQKTKKELTQQETTALLWLSLNLKNKLIEINDLLSQLRSDIAHFSPRQQEMLKKVHQKIRFLHQESQKVKNIIDEETDEVE